MPLLATRWPNRLLDWAFTYVIGFQLPGGSQGQHSSAFSCRLPIPRSNCNGGGSHLQAVGKELACRLWTATKGNTTSQAALDVRRGVLLQSLVMKGRTP